MVASATKATATVVTWVGDLVQECDNHIGKVHTWHSYHCSWFSLSISLRSWQVMNKNSREIFETIKCSLFIHPLPFYTCEVAPQGGGIVRTDMTFLLRGHGSCRHSQHVRNILYYRCMGPGPHHA
jgi:hypothetical protein